MEQDNMKVLIWTWLRQIVVTETLPPLLADALNSEWLRTMAAQHFRHGGEVFWRSIPVENSEFRIVHSSRPMGAFATDCLCPLPPPSHLIWSFLFHTVSVSRKHRETHSRNRVASTGIYMEIQLKQLPKEVRRLLMKSHVKKNLTLRLLLSWKLWEAIWIERQDQTAY